MVRDLLFRVRYTHRLGDPDSRAGMSTFERFSNRNTSEMLNVRVEFYERATNSPGFIIPW